MAEAPRCQRGGRDEALKSLREKDSNPEQVAEALKKIASNLEKTVKDVQEGKVDTTDSQGTKATSAK